MRTLQLIAAAAHLFQAQIGGLQYLIEQGPQDIPLKVNTCSITFQEIIDAADRFIAFGKGCLFLLAI